MHRLKNFNIIVVSIPPQSGLNFHIRQHRLLGKCLTAATQYFKLRPLDINLAEIYRFDLFLAHKIIEAAHGYGPLYGLWDLPVEKRAGISVRRLMKGFRAVM